MFKKILLFFLLCASVAAFSACSDSSSDNGGIGFIAVPEGTYNVTFFGTATKMGESPIVISDNCTMAFQKGIAPALNACDQLSKSTGEIVISNDNGKLKIISKLQMEGGSLIALSPGDKFQYTEYNAITPALNKASGNGEGVAGYNLDTATGELSEVPKSFPTSPFSFTLVGDILTIKMTLKGKDTPVGPVDAATTVTAKKKNDSTVAPSKTRFWDFTN